MPKHTAPVDSARAAADREARQMGYTLVDVELVREPTGRFLRFFIDKPQGVTLDDCEAFHRRIQPLMEKIDDLDLDSKSLREQAGEVYDKLKENGVDLGISKEEALNWFQKIIKWFRDMWSRYVG